MKDIKNFITEGNGNVKPEEIKGVVANYYKAAETVFNEGLKFLKDFLTDKDFYYFEDDNEIITVSYDGGSYVGGSIANPFSVADGIFVKKGRVFVACEEDEEYELKNATPQDVANIVKYVLTH